MCREGWVHQEGGAHVVHRGQLVPKDPLVQLVLKVYKVTWVPQDPLVCKALQEYRDQQDCRVSRETPS